MRKKTKQSKNSKRKQGKNKQKKSELMDKKRELEKEIDSTDSMLMKRILNAKLMKVSNKIKKL